MKITSRKALKRFREHLEDYMGRSDFKIEVYADPWIKDTYAIQADFRKAGPKVHFLLVNDNLEEVEFASWPPRVRRCR